MNQTATFAPGAASSTHFDRTLAVHARDEPGLFFVDLDTSWASLRGVHGGYMTALAVRAAEQTAAVSAGPDRVVRTIATTFLRPAAVGPAELRVEELRSGRSFTTALVELRQDGRAITNTRITMLTAPAGHSWAEPVSDRPAPRDRCVSFTPPPSIRHFQQAELLIDPATIPMGDGSSARIAGHVRPNDGRAIDAAWLAMIGDWFPPSPFRRFDPPIGGVSIDYTVHLHRVPDRLEHVAGAWPGGAWSGGAWSGGTWLEGVFVTPNSSDGIALEHGTLALPDGTLVAETFHTRWTG